MDDYKNFLKEIVKKCQSKADLCRALDKKPTGGNRQCNKKMVQILWYSTS